LLSRGFSSSTGLVDKPEFERVRAGVEVAVAIVLSMEQLSTTCFQWGVGDICSLSTFGMTSCRYFRRVKLAARLQNPEDLQQSPSRGPTSDEKPSLEQKANNSMSLQDAAVA
jgi:hypothetical protein